MAAEVAAATNPIIQELVTAVEQLTTSRYLCGVALVLSIYDWILLSGDESLTIWKTRWTLPKMIYYFNRVVTPLGLITATFQLSDLRTEALPKKFCQVYTFTNSLIELLSFFLSNWLLTTRLVALYKRKKAIVWFLYIFLILSYLATGGMMVYTLWTFTKSVEYNLIVHACGSTTRSPLMPVVFLAPAAFEFTLFFLTAYSAWKDARIMSSSKNAPFLTVLYRDGMICFFVMFGVRIWNVWIYATQPLSAAYMGIYLLWAVMTILSTRIYLNLVFLSRSPTIEQTEISHVQFASPVKMGGIRVRMQKETWADVTWGNRPGEESMARYTRGLGTLDTSFGIDQSFSIDTRVYSHETIMEEPIEVLDIGRGDDSRHKSRVVSWMDRQAV